MPDSLALVKAQGFQRGNQLLLKGFITRFGHDTDAGLSVNGANDVIWRRKKGGGGGML